MKSDFLRSVDHYENFPVASFLLPKSIRKPIIDVYNFARLADDIADEGNNSSEERLRLLKIFENVLKNENISSNFNTLIEKNIFFTSRKLKESLTDLNVNLNYAHDLLNAFKYDSSFSPFLTWNALDNYCQNSANPIGRILLSIMNTQKSLKKKISPEILQNSDLICSGLQIINFSQDAKKDISKNRITYPKEICPKSIKEFNKEEFESLSMIEKNKLTRSMANMGLNKLKLGKELPLQIKRSNINYKYRFALEISLTLQCGIEIAKKLLKNPSSVWEKPPKISKFTLPKLLIVSTINLFN